MNSDSVSFMLHFGFDNLSHGDSASSIQVEDIFFPQELSHKCLLAQ